MTLKDTQRHSKTTDYQQHNLHFILIHKKGNTDSIKKFKRKFTKYCNWKNVTTLPYSDADHVTCLLADILKQVSKNTTGDICIIWNNTRTNYFALNVLPKTPITWDALSFKTNIKKYNYDNINNNQHWTSCSLLETEHLILNRSKIAHTIKVLKESRDWDNFLDAISKTFICFASNNRHFDNSNSTSEDFVYTTTRVSLCNKTVPLPAVSLVSVVKNESELFKLVYNFLTLDTNVALELVLVTCIKLPSYVPSDERIKVVELGHTSMDTSFDTKLNLGVQYASNSIISHFFSGTFYQNNYVETLLKSMILTSKDCILSGDSVIYNNGKSLINSQPCVSNMMYFKQFWAAGDFSEGAESLSLTSFLKHRLSTVIFVPSINLSVKVIEGVIDLAVYKELHVPVVKLLDKKLQDLIQL
jgi:hypothetical protein